MACPSFTPTPLLSSQLYPGKVADGAGQGCICLALLIMGSYQCEGTANEGKTNVRIAAGWFCCKMLINNN